MVLSPDTRHPLKKELFEYNIKLWDVALALKKTPGYISQVLNGRIPMPTEIEKKIQSIVDEVKRDREQSATTSR